jgi:methyltransferase (TIGR00027 family)
MDMFAFRRPELMSAVEVFEIDYPATQADKQQRLARARLEAPPNLHFIPADLEEQSLASVLAGSTFDPTRLSFFAWLGVTHYLTKDAIAATLRTIRSAAAPRSRLAFDYIDLDAFVSGKAAPRVTRMMERTRRLGEPVISGFDPSSLAAELGTFGFQLIEHLSPREIAVRYFASRPDGLHATEHSYFACAVVVSG